MQDARGNFCRSDKRSASDVLLKLQVTSLKLQEGDCVAFKMFRSSMVTFILFLLSALQIFQDFINAGLGIAKQHAGVFLVEQGIVDAGVA
jgi:hypothetical protein